MDLLLPKDGSIVVIDDQYLEAKPLLKLLSENGYPAIYFDGNLDSLPSLPLHKVRIVFADIQLLPNLNEDQYAQLIVDHLNRLIPEVNGPYVLIIWSGKEDLYADKIVEVLGADNFKRKPISIIRLNKNDYFRTEDADNDMIDLESIEESLHTMFNQDDLNRVLDIIANNTSKESVKQILPNALKEISKKLRNGIKKFKAFEFLIEWEHIVNSSSRDFISNVSSIHSFDGYWDYNFRNIISRMAEAQVGKHIGALSSKEFIEAAFKTFNTAFVDLLNSNIPANFPFNNAIKEFSQTGYKIQIGSSEYCINWKKFKKYELYINGVKVTTRDKVDSLGKQLNPGTDRVNVESMSIKYSLFNPMLNTNIHIDTVTKNPLQPGILYKLNIHALKKRKLLGETYFSNAFFKRTSAGSYEIPNDSIKKILFVELEVSPNCDFAQNKWLKNRFISGILYPSDIETKNKLKLNKGDLSLYDTFPLIKLDNEVYRLCFSFKLLKSLDFNTSKLRSSDALFRIKNEAMADIVSRMASHATRIGLIEFK